MVSFVVVVWLGFGKAFAYEGFLELFRTLWLRRRGGLLMADGFGDNWMNAWGWLWRSCSNGSLLGVAVHHMTTKTRDCGMLS